MADNETTINLRFKVNDDGSVSLDKIGQKISQIDQNTKTMSGSLGLIKWDSIVNLGERAYHTAQQIYGMAKEAAAGINEIDRMTKISGLASDAFQKMAYAAKMTDVDTETLGRGMKTLAGHMDDVRKGNETAKILFEGIGISTIDAAGKTKSFDEILGQIADRFKSMPDGIQKVALATDLFGKSGQNLIPMLDKGSAGLKEFYTEAERLGIVLDEKLIKKGSELEDNFKRAEAWWSAFFKKIVVGAYEAIEALGKLAERTKDIGQGTLEKSRQSTAEWKRARGYPESQIPEIPAKNLMGLTGEQMVQAYKEENIPAGPVTIRQSDEAIKAMTKSLEEAAKKEAALNEFFQSDAELLRQAERSIANRTKGLDLLDKLGIKTGAGAKREIEAVMEDFKTIAGMGLTDKEMDQAKVKMTEQLNAIKTKYSTTFKEMEEVGHWEDILMPTGREIKGANVSTTWGIGERWVAEVRAMSVEGKDTLTKAVEEMVTQSIDELDRMQRQIDQATKAPAKVSIDTTAFDSANAAIETLRAKLDEIDGRVLTVTIDQRVNGDTIEAIEQGLTTRFINKQSRFRNVILGGQ